MWKKAFIGLLSLNLLILVALVAWWGSLPKAGSPSAAPHKVSNTKAAQVRLSVGQQAINAYLKYALTNQSDVKNVLSYADIRFGNDWAVNLGAKLAGRIVPLNAVFVPEVKNGNLDLHMKDVTVGNVPLPTSAFFIVFHYLPWPNWIKVDPNQQTLDLNFTQRPQHPYGLRVLGYSKQTKRLTLLVTIDPKSVGSLHSGINSSSGSNANGG